MMTPNKKMLIALLVVVVAVLVGLGMYKKSCACKKAAVAAPESEKKVTIASPETAKPMIKKVSAPEDAKVAPAEPMPVLAA